MFDKLPPVVWVDEQSVFEKLTEKWQSTNVLAIDTEFERRTTYYPIFALLQIFDGEKIYLIDPLKIKCTPGFQLICANPSITKIMHSAKEDLEVFYCSWQCQFKRLFDTQIAYAFDSGNISIGYASLIKKLSDIDVAKEETQSNWLARPLSKTQLDYAAKDVLYLPQIYQILKAKQDGCLYRGWFEFECQEISEQAYQNTDYDVAFRMAKDVWRLDGQQLNLFKLLYQWRETVAINENRTRNHIAKDVQLVEIVQLMPQDKNDFQKIRNFHPKSIRLYSKPILNVVAQFKSSSMAYLKVVPNPRDLSDFNSLSQLFLQAVELVAKNNNIEPAVLAGKRLTRKFAFAYLAKEPFPANWFGWRQTILKPEFDRIFAQLEST